MTAPELIHKHLYSLTLKYLEEEEGIDSAYLEPIIPSNYEDIVKHIESYDFWDQYYESKSELRQRGVNTDIESKDWSRHYESQEVAAEIYGKWIGWTYWYGGGKHGDPSSVEWIDDAYFVKMEEKKVLVKTFTRVED